MRLKWMEMMTKNADPWELIQPPSQSTNVSSRRVDPDLQWDMFWAMDIDRNCLLILQYDKEKRPKSRLPRLRGLKVGIHTPDSGAHDLLVIRLVDNENRAIFHRLCLDIISAVELAKSEEEAVERFLGRTWSWHRLLRSGRNGRLSDEEQKGLLGELGVLRRILIPATGVQTAVRSWTGPLGAPKDFEIGRICIEVKARRGAASPHIAISTEHQLDTDGIDALFLQVTEITAAADNDRKSVTITDVARQVRDEIESQDMSSVEFFEMRLSAVGFDWADDYTDKQWLIGREHFFQVREGFPRITPSMFPSGVSNLRYTISLLECEPFRVDIDALTILI